MNIDDIQPGDPVLYIPNYAHGNRVHPDCERGVVSSKNSEYVFVRYYRYGVLQRTAQATRPEDLTT